MQLPETSGSTQVTHRLSSRAAREQERAFPKTLKPNFRRILRLSSRYARDQMRLLITKGTYVYIHEQLRLSVIFHLKRSPALWAQLQIQLLYLVVISRGLDSRGNKNNYQYDRCNGSSGFSRLFAIRSENLFSTQLVWLHKNRKTSDSNLKYWSPFMVCTLKRAWTAGYVPIFRIVFFVVDLT